MSHNLFLVDQAKGLEANRHKVNKRFDADGSGAAAMFLTVLEGMVYTIGTCTFYILV